MIPNDRAFNGKPTFEDNGKTYYRSYRIERTGKFRLIIEVVSINSEYRQAIAFSLSNNPKFNGAIFINGTQFIPEKKKQHYVMPVDLPDKSRIVMDLDVTGGYFMLANASDFLDDYPDLIEKISAQTGRSREEFRGNSYTSGFTAANRYGNSFYIEQLSENKYRFYCNDHKMDDDFDDLVFDMEITD